MVTIVAQGPAGKFDRGLETGVEGPIPVGGEPGLVGQGGQGLKQGRGPNGKGNQIGTGVDEIVKSGWGLEGLPGVAEAKPALGLHGGVAEVAAED